MSDIKCPKCGSSRWNCWDEHDEVFQSVDDGEFYEAPVGYLKCLDCGTSYAHHDNAPDLWIGNPPSDSRDGITW